MKQLWKKHPLGVLAVIAFLVFLVFISPLLIFIYNAPQGTEHGTYDLALSRSLISTQDLPNSVHSFWSGSNLNFESLPTSQPKGSYDVWPPIWRPGKFGFKDWHGDFTAEGAATSGYPVGRSDGSLELRLSRHATPEAAQEFWGKWPIERSYDHEQLFKSTGETAPRATQLALRPKLEFEVEGGLHWQGACTNWDILGSYENGKIPEVGSCQRWSGWTHFCEWTFDVIIYRDVPSGRRVDDPAIPKMMSDLAAAQMQKLGCKVAR